MGFFRNSRRQKEEQQIKNVNSMMLALKRTGMCMNCNCLCVVLCLYKLLDLHLTKQNTKQDRQVVFSLVQLSQTKHFLS